jgi:3alpha(or 20beta)-hydroxysteroid dehydrogenase
MGTRLAGKVAIITGASRGQGAATAKLFAAEGAQVMLADVSAPDPCLVASLEGDAHFMRHDVSDATGWRDLVTATQKEFGRVNILINNAGVYRPSGLADTDDALWEFHYRVNQLGVFLGMRSVIDAMRASGGGAIVNVSSNAGIAHVPGIFAYATTKWAVRGMSKLAASELAGHGIRVNVVFPGIIDTPMLGDNTPERLEMYRNMIPMKRMGAPEEVARLSLFLASDEASYITGAEVSVDGGIG